MINAFSRRYPYRFDGVFWVPPHHPTSDFSDPAISAFIILHNTHALHQVLHIVISSVCDGDDAEVRDSNTRQGRGICFHAHYDIYVR